MCFGRSRFLPRKEGAPLGCRLSLRELDAGSPPRVRTRLAGVDRRGLESLHPLQRKPANAGRSLAGRGDRSSGSPQCRCCRRRLPGGPRRRCWPIVRARVRGVRRSGGASASAAVRLVPTAHSSAFAAIRQRKQRDTERHDADKDQAGQGWRDEHQSEPQCQEQEVRHHRKRRCKIHVDGMTRPAGPKPADEAAGRARAMADKTEHVIHNQDGTISERNSYGGDPSSRVG